MENDDNNSGNAYQGGINLFGWTIARNVNKEKKVNTFVPQQTDDGALVVPAGGSYGTYVDLEGTVKTEAELVTRYRQMSMLPEVQDAIEDITNEAIVTDDDDYIVKINLDGITGLSPDLKARIIEEFDEVLELLDFENYAYELFQRWYIDGRMYFHAILDETAMDGSSVYNGLYQLRYIDPRKIRKVREIKDIMGPNGIVLKQTIDEYYLYSEMGFDAKNPKTAYAQATTTAGLRISLDSIIHVTSGLMDENNQLVLSYLHRAIKPLNQLRSLEDATVIYTLARAPERRVFYIDVGNLPKQKAEQHLRDTMVQHKNKLIYDASTGEVRDDRKFLTMLEDYWLPRREGGRGTEVDTLPGGQNTGVMEHVEYFLKKLMKALGVPSSRQDPSAGFALGRASEISRDEVKFSKFVARLRKRFSMLFVKILEKNLVLKGVCSLSEFERWQRKMVFDFKMDNHFAELKDNEILMGRVQLATTINPMIGHYYSHEFVRKTILKQTDEEMAKEDSLISKELTNPQYKNMYMGGMTAMNDGDGFHDAFGGGGEPEAGAGEGQFGDQPESMPSNPSAGGPAGTPPTA